MGREDYSKNDIRLYLTNYWSHLAQGYLPERGAPEDNWPPKVSAVTSTSDAALSVMQIKVDIETAIKRLPAPQRLAVVLHFVEREPLSNVGLWLRHPKATKASDSGLPLPDLVKLIEEGIDSMHKDLNKGQWGGARPGTGPKSSRRGKGI